MKQVSDADFDSEVLSNERPVLVDVFASWCGPCKALAPTLEKLSTAYDGRASIVKVDGETETNTVSTYEVRALPTLLFFKGGTMQKKLIGLQSEKTIRETLDSLI